MILRTFAEFDTDVVDYSLEDEDFDAFMKASGLVITEMLIEMLRRPDRQILSPDYVGDGRWQFQVKTEGRKLFFQAQLIEKVLLFTKDETSILFAARDATTLAEVLDQLNVDLQKDPRVHNIKWCYEAEILDEGPGASSPKG